MTYQQNNWPSLDSSWEQNIAQLLAIRVTEDQKGHNLTAATAVEQFPRMKRSSKHGSEKPASMNLRINGVSRIPVEHSTRNVNEDLGDGDATPIAKWEGYSAPPLPVPVEKIPSVFYPYLSGKDLGDVTPRSTKQVASGSAPRFPSTLNPRAAAFHPKNIPEDCTADPDPEELDDFLGALLNRENSKLATTPPVKSGPPAPLDRETGEKELANDMLCLIRQGKKLRIPPPGYVCHICLAVQSHLIFDCPEKGLSDSETPYEGPQRCFGYFQCKSCKRKWTSSSSYSRMSQRCFKCQDPTFPYKQLNLDAARELGLMADNKKPSSVGSHGRYRNATRKDTHNISTNTTASSVGYRFNRMRGWKETMG